MEKTRVRLTAQHILWSMADGALDWYEVLGVAADASKEEIRQAYRRKALASHPDKTKAGSDCFMRISHAATVLLDPEQRRAFDAARMHLATATKAAAAPSGDMELDDMTFVEPADEDGGSGWYSHACRCGGVHRVREDIVDVAFGSVDVPCDSCALVLRVVLPSGPS